MLECIMCHCKYNRGSFIHQSASGAESSIALFLSHTFAAQGVRFLPKLRFFTADVDIGGYDHPSLLLFLFPFYMIYGVDLFSGIKTYLVVRRSFVACRA
jgi:hypothetical protein